MKDSENNPIFASLNENDKGGSIVETKNGGIVKFKYDNLEICLSDINKNFYVSMTQYSEVRYMFTKVIEKQK
jgi:hypothetical protein